MITWDKVREVVAGVAPVAGSMLLGPAGGAVGAMISAALGVDNDPAAVMSKLQSDPAALYKLRQVEAELEAARINARSAVVQAEANGESWLQRNWRPITMLWFSVLIGGYWFGFTPENLTETTVIALFDIVQLGLSGYIVGRSVEKVAKTVTGAGLLSRLTGK